MLADDDGVAAVADEVPDDADVDCFEATVVAVVADVADFAAVPAAVVAEVPAAEVPVATE